MTKQKYQKIYNMMNECIENAWKSKNETKRQKCYQILNHAHELYMKSNFNVDEYIANGEFF